jgi:hypothetical protein
MIEGKASERFRPAAEKMLSVLSARFQIRSPNPSVKNQVGRRNSLLNRGAIISIALFVVGIVALWVLGNAGVLRGTALEAAFRRSIRVSRSLL